MKNRPITQLAAALLVAGVLGLAACSSDDASAPAPTVTVTVTETAAAEVLEEEAAIEDQEAVETEEADDSEPGSVAAFGESVTLPDDEGTITISAPEPFEPDAETTFIDGDWDEYVVMTVTETNDRSEPVMAGWSITATTGSVEAEAIFDAVNGVEVPNADVMPGSSIEYKIAFGRNAGEEFVLRAGPLDGWGVAYFQ